MVLYKTVKREGEAEWTVRRSRFIGYCAPIGSREEGEAFLDRIRALHPQATHRVPALVVGEKMELAWTSDDGEPQGTAGPPVLKLLMDEGFTNLICVVVRYFGGVKLGTGGLVRAYTEAARLALDAAGSHLVRRLMVYKFRFPYGKLGKLQNLAEEGWFSLEEILYQDLAEVTLSVAWEDQERLEGLLADLNSGQPEGLEKEERLL